MSLGRPGPATRIGPLRFGMGRLALRGLQSPGSRNTLADSGAAMHAKASGVRSCTGSRGAALPPV
ncbi:hypothetical protein XAP412_250017 [Xanthomonas phaseoli pv. phaseoli]|uniref:Secreted protein n=1 Tax=Xanthomonas campestris pv. phaseoli TaxID=317013 RepID=A0AB38DY39_XANCH|nr:hypothetical protein XAP6984_310102 [Xanthomonas phaseoli pv. phaseoli]SON82325.1 hypothetical protein XAP412_250017 [Xanthomonas phaseoli pv. phaseoli]SON86473.1 hypothetical protein XAP7430_260101 [Xanthomonas phaseoli pv. phaseoli]